MIKKNHNDVSRQFMQKVLLFIDSVLLNAAGSDSQDVNKVLMSGVLNIRDALFTEVLKDNQVDSLNQFLEKKEESKKKLQNLQSPDLSQEKESAKNQED